MTRIAVFIVIFHLSLLLGATAGAQVSVEVISAEVLRVGDRFYHLHGIDAPEPRQKCVLASRLYPCGEVAVGALMDLVAGGQAAARGSRR